MDLCRMIVFGVVRSAAEDNADTIIVSISRMMQAVLSTTVVASTTCMQVMDMYRVACQRG